MRRYPVLSSIVGFSILILAGVSPAAAQCALPYQLTNGQTADATQVMANFNALIGCFGSQGATNSVQYSAGSGAFAGVGPLTNGQLVVGSSGAAPQAQTLSAGAGIAISNGPGSITIAATGGQGGTGLYRQVMSATPTSAGTGLTNWLNQGSATVADSAVGLNITAPSSGANLSARFMAAPSTPYTITALIAATRDSNAYSGVGIGWYDGSSKLHLLSYIIHAGATPFLEVEKWNSATSWNSNDYVSNGNAFSQPIWLRIRDDGSNVSFAFSQDGANFLQLFIVAKSSGWLGASGYSNVIFFVSPQGGQTLGTLMSWTQG
jgi:hypothetical protein